METFAELVSPVTTDAFFSDFWEQRPLWLTGRPASVYDGLFSTEQLDELIRWRALQRGELRFAGPGSSELSVRLLRSDGRVDQAIVTNGRSRGLTLVLELLQWRIPILGRLCRSLEQILGQPVIANAIQTPSNCQGFDVHFDYVDVFVAQLEGRKHWKVYSPIVDLPVQEQFRALERTALGTPILEVDLVPGDLLFIPRGFPHEAIAFDAPSLQVGIAVHGYRWADLLEECVREVAHRLPELRRAVPPGSLDPDQLVDLSGPFADRLNTVLQHFDGPAALRRLAKRHLEWTRPVAPPPTAKLPHIASFHLARQRLAGIFGVPGTDEVDFIFDGGSVRISTIFTPILEAIVRRESVTPAEWPGSSRDNSRLLDRLLADGVLVPVGDGR